MRIQALPAHIANQIAAGEMIDRPASVLKELLENSIDSGGTEISVYLEKGGKQCIRVQDNGRGIHPEDLQLALQAHATSKIRTAEDLEAVRSLGFRGEALASIAAVSRLSLISAIENHTAKIIKSAGTELILPSAAAHPRGTTVEVRDLFFNIPVRRQFLRLDKTEWMHCFEILKFVALSRSTITLRCIHEDKMIAHWPRVSNDEDRVRRIAKICGKKFVENSIRIQAEEKGLALEGWISPPQFSTPYATGQFFFLNGRLLRDKLIQHALRSFTESHYPAGRHLAYVLYLSIDPRLVNVNVHPTKYEVRFCEPRLIHHFITRALNSVLERVHSVSIPNAMKAMEATVLNTLEPRVEDPFGTPISYLKNRYLLCETAKALNIFDLKKTERFIFEKAIFIALENKESLPADNLAPPCTLSLNTATVQRLSEATIPWIALGLDWQIIGKEAILVRRLPKGIPLKALNPLFHELSLAKDWFDVFIQFRTTDPLKSFEDHLQQLHRLNSSELKQVTHTLTWKEIE